MNKLAVWLITPTLIGLCLFSFAFTALPGIGPQIGLKIGARPDIRHFAVGKHPPGIVRAYILTPGRAANGLQDTLEITRLPKPQWARASRQAGLQFPDDQAYQVTVMPASFRTLWRLQSKRNKALVRERIGRLFQRARFTVTELLQHPRFKSAYEPELQQILTRVGKQSVRSQVTPEKLAKLIETAKRIFSEGMFIENLCTKGILNKGLNWIGMSDQSVLSDPDVRHGFQQRLQRILSDKALQDIFVAFVSDYLKNLIQDAQFRQWLGTFFSDRAFEPVIAGLADRIQSEVRQIIAIVLNVDGGPAKMHPIAGEVVQAALFNEKRFLLIAVSKKQWRKLPAAITSGQNWVTPLARAKPAVAKTS